MTSCSRRIHRTLAGVLLLLAGAVAGAAAEAQGPAPALTLAGPAAAPPTIDGNLDDECWREAAQDTGFVLNERPVPATEQTSVFATYDQRNLYVAFECLESQMDRLAANIAERDGQVFKDDVVEVFIDPNRDRFTYYQFVVNARGTRFDLKGDAAGGNPRWDAPWEAAVTRGEDRWSVEMAIPFSSLDIHVGKTGSTWGINFAREQKPKGELSVWSFTGGAFARPARFGELNGLSVDFERYAYGVELVDLGEKLIGTNVVKARITSPAAGRARVGLQIYLPDGQAKYSEVSAALSPDRPATVMLPYELPREGNYRMVVRVRGAQDGEVLHAVGVPISVPPLLELALYPNHYRQEVMLRPRLNVRQADLKAFRLTARLMKNNTRIATREKPFFVTKEPLIPFDLSHSGPGEYEIQVTLAPNRPGAGLVKETLRFTHGAASKPAATASTAPSPPAVSIGPDNTLRVHGRRFFPLGIYRYGAFSDRSLREMRDTGFNLVQAVYAGTIPETREVMDRVQAHGLKVWMPLGEAMEIPENDDKKPAALKYLVAGLASHPALLCWESIDEPAWGSRSADGLYRGYRIVRALDPDHPVWTNHAPRNTVDELAYFNRATDIAGADIYPVPEPQTQSDLPNKRIAVVGDETDKNILAVLNRKPVFMVLQGFAWADLSRRTGGTDPAVYPSFAQSRFMAYQSVVRGARGILYWGTHYTPKPSPFWNSLRRVVHELSQMGDVLAGPDAGDYVKVQAGGKAIKTLIRRHARTGDRFVIAVNTSAQPVEARLLIPRAMSKVSWRVLFERRRVVGNPISDYFEPYGVHVYTASATFPQERFLELPPVTEIQRPRPEDLTQAGNLLVNPGFEYTEDEDAPVGWDHRPAFAGGVATDVRRTGKYSVTLQGRSADSMPLWLQTGLDTEAGRRYRFTAQVKTRPAGTQYRIYAEWNSDTAYLGGRVPETWSAGTGDWREASLEFTVDHAEAKKMYVVLQVHGQGQAWFDDVRLEEMR